MYGKEVKTSKKQLMVVSYGGRGEDYSTSYSQFFHVNEPKKGPIHELGDAISLQL